VELVAERGEVEVRTEHPTRVRIRSARHQEVPGEVVDVGRARADDEAVTRTVRDPAASLLQRLLVDPPRDPAAELPVVEARGRVGPRVGAQPVDRLHEVDEPQRERERDADGDPEPDEPVRPIAPRIDATELPAGPAREAVGAPWCQGDQDTAAARLRRIDLRERAAILARCSVTAIPGNHAERVAGSGAGTDGRDG